jgi:hypothetical protein
MGLRSHLKQHGVGWLTTGLSTVLAFYFYRESIEARDPVFLVDPNRTEIISHARVETAPIRVLRHDGRPVTGDLYALRFYFWNAGKTSIRSGNVLDTIRITLDDPAEIIEYKVLNRTRPITSLELRPHRVGDRLNKLNLAFSILEHHDGFAGQIIYEGTANAHIRIVGIVEGVPHGVRDGSAFGWLGVIRYSVNGWLFLVGAAAALGLAVGIGAFLRALYGWSTRPPAPAPAPGDRRRPTTRADLIAGALFFLFFLIVIGASMLTKYDTVREEARMRSVNSVPRAVLP